MASKKEREKEKEKNKDKEPPDISNFDTFIDKITKDVKTITDVDPTSQIRWLNCYNVAVNMALSGHPEKGLPFGKIINFEGESDTGKTLLALTAIREAQKQYGSLFRCLVIDSERGMAISRCADLGIFIKKKPKNSKKPDIEAGEDDTGDPRAGTFKILQTTDLTTIADKILPDFLAVARSRPEMVFILMIDSISMLVTSHERESAFETRDLARAQELRKFMRLLNDGYSGNLTVFTVHHQADRIATGGGILPAKPGSHNKDIGGGKAVKFVPSVRLEVSFTGKEKRGSGDNERIIGQRCRVEVIKTRLYKPMIRAETYIDHNTGFTQLGGLADQLVQIGAIVEKGGGRWVCPPVFGEKSLPRVEMEAELEKPENSRKVVAVLMERMQIVPFGAEGNTEEKEEAPDPLDLEKLTETAKPTEEVGKAKE